MIQIKGTLEGISLGSDDCIVPIGSIIVLEKKEVRSELCIELRSLFGIPEHVVIAAQKDLSAGQFPDVLQICLTLSEIFSPTVVSDQNKGVLRPDHLRAVSAELFLVIFPGPAVELSGRL
jgi:hypothetical protein